MKVKECMSKNVNWINPESSVKECAQIMCDNHVGCVPVCDNENKVVGIVTDRDILLRNVACDKNANNTKVSEIMTKNVFCCEATADLTEAEKIMTSEQVRRVPIVDKGKLVGILTLGDLAINGDIYENELCNTIEGICGCNNKNCQ